MHNDASTKTAAAAELHVSCRCLQKQIATAHGYYCVPLAFSPTPHVAAATNMSARGCAWLTHVATIKCNIHDLMLLLQGSGAACAGAGSCNSRAEKTLVGVSQLPLLLRIQAAGGIQHSCCAEAGEVGTLKQQGQLLG